MKKLDYALSLAIPVITALLLLTLGAIAAEFIVELYSSGRINIYLKTIATQPESGVWAISGALFGAIASMTLLVAWDTYKDYKYRKRQDEAIINCIREEMNNCSQYIQACIDHLQQELDTISRRPQATLVAPPPLIELNYWELLRTHIPKAIIKNSNLLSGLRTLSNVVISFNSQLDSREQYHIHCKINNNFYEQMEIFDKTLVEYLPKLQEVLDAVSEEFEKSV